MAVKENHVSSKWNGRQRSLNSFISNFHFHLQSQICYSDYYNKIMHFGFWTVDAVYQKQIINTFLIISVSKKQARKLVTDYVGTYVCV